MARPVWEEGQDEEGQGAGSGAEGRHGGLREAQAVGLPHLLELIHPLLQLHAHRGLLFPPGRQRTKGDGISAESFLAPVAPCSHLSGSGLSPGSGSLGGEELWTGMSGWPGGGQLQLSGGSTPPGQCRAPQLPSRNVWATHQQLYLRATVAALVLRRARPTQVPAQPAVWLASSPTSCPHQTTRPTRPSLPPSAAQIRSPASCLHQNRAPLACGPASCGTI